MHAMLWILAALLASSQATTQPAVNPDSNAAAIRASRGQLNAALARRTFNDMKDVLGENVSSIGPAKRSLGTDDFIGFYVDLVKRRPDLVLVREPASIRVDSYGDLGAESGEWHESWTQDGVLTELRGPYFALWKKKAGHWLLDAETFLPLSCSGGSYCK